MLLRCLFAQMQLPLPIKRQIFTSLTRAKMEYASAIWYCNSAQEKRLESVQHKACTLMLRTNLHSNQTALRSILKLPRLNSRRKMLRLFYVATLLGKTPDTWARHCFELPPSTTCKIRGISQSPWNNKRIELIRNSEILSDAFRLLLGHVKAGGKDMSTASLYTHFVTVQVLGGFLPP